MTHKDFNAIATLILYHLHDPQGPNVFGFEVELADWLEKNNPRFDHARFVKSCRGQESIRGHLHGLANRRKG
jgi:hypothetical protein